MEQQKRWTTKTNTPVALDWENHQSRMTGVFSHVYTSPFGQLIEQEQLMCSFLRVIIDVQIRPVALYSRLKKKPRKSRLADDHHYEQTQTAKSWSLLRPKIWISTDDPQYTAAEYELFHDGSSNSCRQNKSGCFHDHLDDICVFSEGVALPNNTDSNMTAMLCRINATKIPTNP